MRVWKFGNDVDTDAIIPGRFLTIYDPAELAKHAFEGTRNDFANGVRPGDIIVGGSNFGSGSSREHAPLALKGAGVQIVIAQSFARIFFRNAINIGLLPLACPDTSGIEDGEAAAVDLDSNTLIVGDRSYVLEPIPGFVRDIVQAGGLVPYARGLKEGVRCTVLQR